MVALIAKHKATACIDRINSVRLGGWFLCTDGTVRHVHAGSRQRGVYAGVTAVAAATGEDFAAVGDVAVAGGVASGGG